MENKKYPIGGFAPGYYHCKCFVCAERFQGDKRATMCEPCAIELAARPKEVADHIGEINGMVNQPVQQEESQDMKNSHQLKNMMSDEESKKIVDRITDKLNIQPSTPIVEEQINSTVMKQTVELKVTFDIEADTSESKAESNQIAEALGMFREFINNRISGVLTESDRGRLSITKYEIQQTTGRKPFTVAYIRDLISQVSKGVISYSRMVELMNEKANERF